MTNVDLMKEFLSSQGFKYEQDEDNDIFFKYQMRNFIFMGSDNDETFRRTRQTLWRAVQMLTQNCC